MMMNSWNVPKQRSSRWRLLAVLASLLLLGLSVQLSAQLTEAEKKGVEDTLFIGNMSLKDLEFERKPFADPYRLALVNLALDKPLEAADKIMALHGEAKTGPIARILGSGLKEALGDTWPRELQPTVTSPPDVRQVPDALKQIVGNLLTALQEANNQIRMATSKLSPQELRILIEGLPIWAVEEPKVKFEFIKLPQPSQKTLLELLSKVELWRIRAASVALTETVDKSIPLLKRTSVDIPKPLKLQAGGMTVVLAGKSNDLHEDTDSRLTIDLGGNDRYTGRHGAGIGYASVLIDLGGDDYYDVKDASVGCGLMGIGVARDCGGTDTFIGGSLCFGSGMGGVGVFVKDGGNDTYRATSLAQGYGQFGVGLCVDTGGDDHYDLKLMGQGAARTQGLGWLIDRSGADVYQAGGLSMNEPLFTGVSYSNAQGYGSGYREDTGGVSGGVGLLTDLGGNDAYLAETYCQAASYWFSLGSLYDHAGNDTYSAYHYAQASAMHMTGAYLFDLAGDDGYIVKFGAAHAIGHDYGVAFFLDRSGDDVVAARDSTPGLGNANGLGLFIDAAGIDRYAGPPGKGNPARGSGSLGVFVDLSGQDLYREGLADGTAQFRDGWGVAYDEYSPSTQDAKPNEQPAENPKPGTIAKPADQELAEIYRKATQWGVGSAQQEVADNIRKLIEIGMPAFDWMIAARLKTADRLQVRAFVEVAKGIGQPAKDAIALKTSSADEDESREALQICIDGVFKEAGPLIPGILQKGMNKRLAVRAAGALGANDAVQDLMPLTLDKDRLLALDAMISLASIGDEQAVSTAQSLLVTGDLPMRKAALQLLSKFPKQALGAGQSLILQDNEHEVRMGIDLLGALGTPEALEAIGPKLIDPRPGVRIEAMLALNGRVPQSFRSYLSALRDDPIPTVRAVAQKIDPGR